MSPQDRTLFLALRDQAIATLKNIGDDLDYGLIHADPVRENIMLDGDRLQLIDFDFDFDFDDGGFGFRLFDIATALLKNLTEPDYPDLRVALTEGYTSRRPIDLRVLDLFIALRSATYVGWIMTRMD
ncbi:phosphotransferase [uncultured Roseovarius sp.]|uniref:phosphotransferase n=1 Tax=uncultured Roseovarius sp. TaxID=293344 RepID=UPI00260FB7FA|nr:phosphotransferase [uncultured Roseovarius sp.]